MSKNSATRQYFKKNPPAFVPTGGLRPGLLFTDSTGRAYIVTDRPTRRVGFNTGIRRLTREQVAQGREKGLFPKDWVSEHDG